MPSLCQATGPWGSARSAVTAPATSAGVDRRRPIAQPATSPPTSITIGRPLGQQAVDERDVGVIGRLVEAAVAAGVVEGALGGPQRLLHQVARVGQHEAGQRGAPVALDPLEPRRQLGVVVGDVHDGRQARLG